MEYLELLGMMVDGRDICNMGRSRSGDSRVACISQEAIKLVSCNFLSLQRPSLEACNLKNPLRLWRGLNTQTRYLRKQE